jgi:hypothetical protein
LFILYLIYKKVSEKSIKENRKHPYLWFNKLSD